MEVTARHIRIGALIAACAVAAGVSFYVLLGDSGLATEIWRGSAKAVATQLAIDLLFYGSLIAIAVWTVLHFAVLRWSAPEKSSTYFAIICAVLVVADTALVGYKFVDTRNQAAHAREVLDSVRAELAKTLVGKDDASPIDMRVEAKGDAGTVLRIVKQFVAGNHAATRAYGAAILDQDFFAFLEPKRLAADRGLGDARAQLAKARASLEAYRSRLAANRETWRAAVRHADLSGAMKEIVILEFDGETTGVGDAPEWLLANEKATFDEISSMIDDLAHARGRWSVVDGRLRFADQRDLAAFNGHVLKVEHFAVLGLRGQGHLSPSSWRGPSFRLH